MRSINCPIKANSDLLFVSNNEEFMQYSEYSLNDTFCRRDTAVAGLIERALKNY